MTIIATDGIHMAADSASFQNEVMFSCYEPKIVHAPDGSLVGATGATGDCHFLKAWVRDGMDFAKKPRFSWADVSSDNSILWLWLRTDGKVHMGDCTMLHWPVPQPVVIGSGAALATGAMAAGMSLYDAVTMAVRRSPYLGGDVQIERLRASLAEAATVAA